MLPFRFAIMGAGNIANHFCDAVRRMDNCQVAAVSSKSSERARQFAEKNALPAFYDDYEEMLIREAPDCVYIAVTPNDHFRLGMLCLKHHTPVLCEKAMFLNAGEAAAFFARARELRVFAMEAMWSRFLPAMNAAREWLRAGEIGEPVLAEIGIGFIAPDDPQNRYFNPALGGGAMYDITVYGYELLTWLLERESEPAYLHAVRAKTGVDATDIVVLRMNGGLPALIRCSFMTPLEERLVVYGTKGKIVVPHAHFASGAELYGLMPEPRERFTDTDTVNGFTYEIAEVTRCVREGQLESKIVPHAATMACAALFDQINAQIAPQEER